ncbi:MAG: hypothetical protein DI601_20295 [Azospirillum brasilense]|nr:MAG: hypothetical protein DI601_20295 [Azospirillum brasilense]
MLSPQSRRKRVPSSPGTPGRKGRPVESSCFPCPTALHPCRDNPPFSGGWPSRAAFFYCRSPTTTTARVTTPPATPPRARPT